MRKSIILLILLIGLISPIIITYFNLNRLLFTDGGCRGKPLKEYIILGKQRDDWTQCHLDLILKNNDNNIRICEYLNMDRDVISSDKDLCYLEVSTRTLNPKGCDKIKKEYRHDNCFKYIALNTYNESYCEGATSKDFEYNNCKTLVYAKRDGDYSNCKIPECLTLAAIKLQDQSVCENKTIMSEQREEIEWCKYDTAIALNNPEFCNNIQKSSFEDSCYSMLAIHNKNSSLCENIKSNQALKEGCIYHANGQNQDTEIFPFSIKIVYPNGGEIFKKGDDIIVGWLSKNVEKVYIKALYYDANGKVGVPDGKNYIFNQGECRITYEPVSATVGNFTIKGGDTGRCGILDESDKIKIEIIEYGASENSIRDTSDNYFSIIK